MDWELLLPESIIGWIASLGSLAATFRTVLFFIRRQRGQVDPLFRWVAKRIDLESTNLILAVRLRTLQARHALCLENLKSVQPQPNSPSGESGPSSIGSSGATLTPRRRSTDWPSKNTSPPPESGPA